MRVELLQIISDLIPLNPNGKWINRLNQLKKKKLFFFHCKLKQMTFAIIDQLKVRPKQSKVNLLFCPLTTLCEIRLGTVALLTVLLRQLISYN